jgi:ABC-type branched-subunit amino acid transport system substrate-binding protein
VRPTLKIGLVAPFEGRYRAVGYDVIYAARQALQEVNATGGVAGYAVELVAYDDGADVAMAVEQAGKLAVDPDVVAAIGHFRTETTRASAEAYAKANLPLVAPAVLGCVPNGDAGGVFLLSPSADTLADAMIERATQLVKGSQESSQRAGEILLIDEGGPLGVALKELAPERQGDEPGWRLMEVSFASSDWRRDVLAQDPLVLLVDLDPVDAGEVVAAVRSGGWSGQVLGGPALAAADFVAVAGGTAQGVSFVTPWPFPADVPGGEAFVVGYRESSQGLEPGPLALPAYEATRLVLEAMTRAASDGEPNRDRVSTALAAVERDGLLGRVAFNEKQEWSGESLYWYHIGPQGVPSL